MARDKDDKKIEAIYSATLQIVLQSGFSGLKMPDIAKAAGLATGTLYIYFKNKEDLVNTLYLQLKSRKMKGLFSQYDPSVPFRSCFRQLWYAYFKLNLVNLQEAVFLEQYFRSPYLQNEVKLQEKQLFLPIYELLDRGKKEQIIKNLDSELLLVQLTGPIHEMTRLSYSEDFSITDAVLEQAFQMAWDGLKL
jgi:AcrR family transcriptional regulator